MTNSLPPLTRLLMIAEMIETEEVFDREEVANILIEIHNEIKKNAELDYCPYDCGSCHDDDCPCPNCVAY